MNLALQYMCSLKTNTVLKGVCLSVCVCAKEYAKHLGTQAAIITCRKVCVSTRVLHAVRIALKAGAQRLCRGIQIRKGPLSVCVRHY